MKKLLIIAALAAVATGCATKTRNVEINGLFTQAEAGMLAVGSVDVMATPAGEEGAMVKFAKDYNFFQSQPNYDIKVQMTGTNSVQRLPDVVQSICEAFVAVAPRVAKSEADEKGATSTIDLAKANREAKADSAQKSENCADGYCTD